MKVPLAVTVTGKQPGRYLSRARALADAEGLPLLRREAGGSLERLLDTEAEALLVLGGTGWALHDAHGHLAWTPGMAQLRLKRLERDGVGGDDHLLQVAELRAGDAVIDGTLGLGSDALVCAHRVGPTGRVIALEASRPLFLLTREGLAASALPPAARVECHHARALDFLRSQPSASVACVVFDPMFERPQGASSAFEALRRFAVHDELDAETLAEARRVAQRWVVVKAGQHDAPLRRLGLPLEADLSRSSAVQWARVAGGAAG